MPEPEHARTINLADEATEKARREQEQFRQTHREIRDEIRRIERYFASLPRRESE